MLSAGDPGCILHRRRVVPADDPRGAGPLNATGSAKLLLKAEVWYCASDASCVLVCVSNGDPLKFQKGPKKGCPKRGNQNARVKKRSSRVYEYYI